MSDSKRLVKRLREHQLGYRLVEQDYGASDMFEEAADEIERLRAALRHIARFGASSMSPDYLECPRIALAALSPLAAPTEGGKNG